MGLFGGGGGRVHGCAGQRKAHGEGKASRHKAQVGGAVRRWSLSHPRDHNSREARRLGRRPVEGSKVTSKHTRSRGRVAAFWAHQTIELFLHDMLGFLHITPLARGLSFPSNLRPRGGSEIACPLLLS